jgi:hypothetical protein
VLVLDWARVSCAQDLDGPEHTFQDPLLEYLTVSGKFAGKVRGRAANPTALAERVLNLQFLRIHEKHPQGPGDGVSEAWVLVGFDTAREH